MKESRAWHIWAFLVVGVLTSSCGDADLCNPSDPGSPCARESTMLRWILQTTPVAGATQTPAASGPCNPCNIFVTTATNQPGVTFNGVTGADARCMSDAAYPGSGTYKALLAQAGVRVACTTANCSGGPVEHTDWILRANTTYRRLVGGATIMTTNADGIHNFGSNLSTAFESGVAGWWTGMTGTWIAGAACTGNAWASTGGSANFGDPATVTSAALSNGTDLCTTAGSKLLCVEQ